MTNERAYIEVKRFDTSWFFKLLDDKLILDHYAEKKNGQVYAWSRTGRTCATPELILSCCVTPVDVLDEAEARRSSIWEETPENPCWGSR